MNDATAMEATIINDLGHAVRRSLVRPEILLEDEVVRDLVAKARQMNEAIAAFKAAAFDEVAAFSALMDQQYGVKAGGTRGGVTLHSFDGKQQVTVSVANTVELGPQIQQAKALIDECLMSWTEGGDHRVTAIINSAFAVGEGGKLRVDRILSLRSLNINDERWTNAMAAINAALRVARSKSYIRFYTRKDREADFEQIVLDASRV